MTGSRRPSLLAVAGVAPWPMRGGFSLRAAHLLRELAADWDITLVAPPTEMPGGGDGLPATIAVLPVHLTPRWRSVPRGGIDVTRLREAVVKAVARNRPDVALLWPGTEFLGFGRRGFPPAVADRVDCATLERIRGIRWRPGALIQVAEAACYERRLVRGLAATVAAGEDDAAGLRRLGGGPSPVVVIPNGVLAQSDPRFDREAPRPTVTFTGTLDYPPNVDAVRYFANAIWPSILQAVPDACLQVAGRSPTRTVLQLGGRRRVEILPDVPDMVAVIQASWVVVAPMRSGVGIKNKVLEAWAAGRPVVQTARATNGLRLNDETAALVANRPDGFARLVTELLGDRDRRHRAGRDGLDLVRSRHTWSGAAQALSEVLRSAIEAAPGST